MQCYKVISTQVYNVPWACPSPTFFLPSHSHLYSFWLCSSGVRAGSKPQSSPGSCILPPLEGAYSVLESIALTLGKTVESLLVDITIARDPQMKPPGSFPELYSHTAQTVWIPWKVNFARTEFHCRVIFSSPQWPLPRTFPKLSKWYIDAQRDTDFVSWTLRCSWTLELSSMWNFWNLPYLFDKHPLGSLGLLFYTINLYARSILLMLILDSILCQNVFTSPKVLPTAKQLEITNRHVRKESVHCPF